MIHLSSYGHAVEQPPANDTQLGVIAGENGCLYSGPTQITMSTDVNGNGQMTVVSPDTPESTVTVNGTNYTWDNNNISSNVNAARTTGPPRCHERGGVRAERDLRPDTGLGQPL